MKTRMSSALFEETYYCVIWLQRSPSIEVFLRRGVSL